MHKIMFTVLSIIILQYPALLQAKTLDDAQFNPEFLSGTNVDIQALNRTNTLPEGHYSLDLYENGSLVGIAAVTVKLNHANKIVVYFRPDILTQLGFKKDIANEYRTAATVDEGIDLVNPERGINVQLNPSTLSANVTIPQIALNSVPRGYVDPAAWDPGSNAMIVNYTSNYYHSETTGNGLQDNYDSFFSTLNTMLNFGAWQFRNYATVSLGEQSDLNLLRTYVQRDIPGLQSIGQAGEVDTHEGFIPSTSLIGASLFTDERMLPDSQRGYVPEIRGIAKTNAKVTVRQNNNIIYETTVSPGEFLISDLYQASYGGDFHVSIQETDGSVRTFVVPYASLPNMLRPGQSTYSFAIGALNDDSLHTKPIAASASYQRGLNNIVTGFTGFQLNQHYQGGIAGLAVNTGIGAISSSLSLSNADMGSEKTAGYNLGLSWSNVFDASETSLNVASYHYSSSGYSTMLDAARVRESFDNGTQLDRSYLRSINEKNSVQINLNQPLSDQSSLYLTAAVNDYWDYSGVNNSYQAGFSSQYKQLSYTLSVSRTWNTTAQNDETQYQLSFSFPLGSSAYAPTLTTAYTQSSDSQNYISTSLYGTALEDHSLSYGINTNIYTSGDSENYVGGNLAKTNQYGMLTSTASKSRNSWQYSAGMTGAVAIHSGGLTFGQYTGDTAGIITAPGAEGATVSGSTNIRVDSHGYALVPYLSAYRDNEVSLDPATAANNVEMKSTVVHVAPYGGAIVKLKFDTAYGPFGIFKLSHQGAHIPLGAVASIQGKNMGLVGSGSLLMVRAQKNAHIVITWNGENDVRKSCSFDIRREQLSDVPSFTKQPVECL